MMIEAALGYVERGFSVIPLTPQEKSPHRALLPRDARGRPTWKPYQESPPSEHEIGRWFQMEPKANLGIVTGAVSGIVVQDLDSSRGLAETHRRGGIPETPVSKTGHGLHVFYRHPGHDVHNFVRRLPGMDLRGDGGYIVAPPSIHPDGHRYHWQVDLSTPIAPPPGWLVELWTEDPAQDLINAALNDPPRPVRSGKYGSGALTNELDRLSKAVNGSRNNTLVTAAFRMGQLIASGRLDREEAERGLTLVSLQIGLTEKETRATVASGISAGMSNPRR